MTSAPSYQLNVFPDRISIQLRGNCDLVPLGDSGDSFMDRISIQLRGNCDIFASFEFVDKETEYQVN